MNSSCFSLLQRWWTTGIKIRGRRKQDNSKCRCNSAPLLREENGRTNGVRLDQLRRTTLTIREVLQHHEGSDTFLRFCQSHYASENLLFWLHAEKYFMLTNRKSAADLDVKLSHKTVVRQAYKIYNRFLRPDAPQWVCIDIETVKEIEEILEDSPEKVDHMLFTQAQEETLYTLEQDLMPRFIKDVVVNRSFKASTELLECLDEQLLGNPPEPYKHNILSINKQNKTTGSIPTSTSTSTSTEPDTSLDLKAVGITVS